MPENPPCHLKEQHTFTRSKDGEAGTNLHGQRPNHEQTHTHTHLPHYMTHDAVDEERTLLWSVATRVHAPHTRQYRQYQSGQRCKVTAFSTIY